MRKVLRMLLTFVMLIAAIGLGRGSLADRPALPRAVSLADSGALAPAPAGLQTIVNGQALRYEQEPNNSSGEATPLAGMSAVVEGNIRPAADADYYCFTAEAGDRVYAATMTAFSSSASDTFIALLNSSGGIIEEDDNDGTFSDYASSIAGAVIPSAGTYYLRVIAKYTNQQIRPYRLYFRLQRGTPVPEVEFNDIDTFANPLPASGWVTGAAGSMNDFDWYTMTLKAGDTVFLSLDLDPERDNVSWNGTVSLGYFDGHW
ncbi:MAG: PPC domain-containing protein, partial [Anaerolineae bacterium]